MAVFVTSSAYLPALSLSLNLAARPAPPAAAAAQLSGAHCRLPVRPARLLLLTLDAL